MTGEGDEGARPRPNDGAVPGDADASAGIPVLRLDVVDSTNDEARRRLDAGELPAAACIVAREQLAGRGTRGRHWDSPRDAGLYLTRVDRFGGGAATSPAPPLFSLAAGVACAEAVEEVFGLALALKPVNDLLLGGGKVGGILVEARIERGATAVLVTGVGLNLRRAPRPAAAGALLPPACVEDALPPGRVDESSRARLEARVIAGLGTWLEIARRGCADVVVRAWTDRAVPGARLPDGLACDPEGRDAPPAAG